jgi:hypothetical protein
MLRIAPVSQRAPPRIGQRAGAPRITTPYPHVGHASSRRGSDAVACARTTNSRPSTSPTLVWVCGRLCNQLEGGLGRLAQRPHGAALAWPCRRRWRRVFLRLVIPRRRRWMLAAGVRELGTAYGFRDRTKTTASDSSAATPARCDGRGHHRRSRHRRGAGRDGLGHHGGFRNRVAYDTDSSNACCSKGHLQSPSLAVASSASMEAMIA